MKHTVGLLMRLLTRLVEIMLGLRHSLPIDLSPSPPHRHADPKIRGEDHVFPSPDHESTSRSPILPTHPNDILSPDMNPTVHATRSSLLPQHQLSSLHRTHHPRPALQAPETLSRHRKQLSSHAL